MNSAEHNMWVAVIRELDEARKSIQKEIDEEIAGRNFGRAFALDQQDVGLMRAAYIIVSNTPDNNEVPAV